MRLTRRLKRVREKLRKRLTFSRLESHSSQFRSFFAKPIQIKRVATGFRFTEGPVWMPETGVLLFSDIPASKIYQLTPAGELSIFRDPSGHTNGLTRDHQGRLIACEHGNRRVTRTELDGSITVLADAFDGKPLNSPNDVVVAKDGAIYFTDPPYGIKSHQQEQAVQGVYRLSAEGLLTQVVDDFDRPNGLVFNPDQTRLYIDDSSKRRHLRVFEVQPDGALANGRIFYDMQSTKPGSPDGMTVDRQGHLFCTGPGGIWVFDAVGNHLGTIILAEQPANCTWGDDDYRSLYVTACTSIYRIRFCQPGFPLGVLTKQ